MNEYLETEPATPASAGVPMNRAARRAEQHEAARAARTSRRSRVRVTRAMSTYGGNA